MKIIGHRGARGLAPENTIVGLQKGLDHHVDGLEFDLRVTKDNVVVLHHDAKLRHPNGQKLAIAEHGYRELRAHKPDLATFEVVLDTIGHPVVLYAEVMPGVPVKPIVAIIQQRLAANWKSEYFLLGSKSQRTLVELQTALPDIAKVVIERWSGVRAGRRARQLGTNIVCMNQLWLWSGFIRAVTGRNGWQLYAYTLNDPLKAKRWAKYGLYAVVTDYPDRFEA